MMIRKRIRARLIDGAFYVPAANRAHAQRAEISGRTIRRFCSDVRYEVLIYGSAIKTSHKPQRISYLQISNRRFSRGLASAQAMLSTSLQHFSFHGIIGLLCLQ